MIRVCLYYRGLPETDRWFLGDHLIRPLVRRIIRGKPRPGGIDRVLINLCLGLRRLAVSYEINLPFGRLRSDDRIGMIGRGRQVLEGYDRPNPIVAGVALTTHPSEWPTLCEDYPIAAYLQHSEWATDVYRPYYGDRCHIWPVGIDTDSWRPSQGVDKEFDFLIYDKIQWNRETIAASMLAAIRRELRARHLTWLEIRYGDYGERDYRRALRACRAMIFLCEHESQGLAYQECLSSGVPILAWDQGWCLDPNRFAWRQPHIPATSVPYFDDRCGLRFRRIEEFRDRLMEFIELERSGGFCPRDYICENLTLEKCARHYVDIANSVALC